MNVAKLSSTRLVHSISVFLMVLDGSIFQACDSLRQFPVLTSKFSRLPITVISSVKRILVQVCYQPWHVTGVNTAHVTSNDPVSLCPHIVG